MLSPDIFSADYNISPDNIVFVNESIFGPRAIVIKHFFTDDEYSATTRFVDEADRPSECDGNTFSAQTIARMNSLKVLKANKHT